MPEEVLFESETKQSRSEIADYLRRVADSLEEDVASASEEIAAATSAVEETALYVSLARFAVEFDLERPERLGHEVAGGARSSETSASASASTSSRCSSVSPP